jgi:hypothetical protein
MYDPNKEWVMSDSDKNEGGQKVPDIKKDQPAMINLNTPRGTVKVYPGSYQK